MTISCIHKADSYGGGLEPGNFANPGFALKTRSCRAMRGNTTATPALPTSRWAGQRRRSSSAAPLRHIPAPVFLRSLFCTEICGELCQAKSSTRAARMMRQHPYQIRCRIPSRIPCRIRIPCDYPGRMRLPCRIQIPCDYPGRMRLPCRHMQKRRLSRGPSRSLAVIWVENIEVAILKEETI